MNSGEPLRMMPIREPPSRGSRILLVRCSRNSSEPSDTRGRPGPKRPAKPFSLCSSVIRFCTFFHSTPKGGLLSMKSNLPLASWSSDRVLPSLMFSTFWPLISMSALQIA
ncbi:hypothetical protein D9M68_987430 [compost metagenome]